MTKEAGVRGLRTAVQAIVGLAVGLFMVVWAVPGVPTAVVDYLNAHVLDLLVSVGFSSGVAGYVWNVLRPR